MTAQKVSVVTGAFGFSGGYIAGRLLAAGHAVRTLTNSPDRESPLHDKVEVHPYDFDDRKRMIASLTGASVLYNNYWVRFNHRDFSYAQAVENSRVSPIEYFRGKAKLEEAVKASGLSYAILRPAVLFGREDILINNIAWFLRRFPAFGVFGDGSYRLQPIYVDDLAELAVGQGAREENVVVDAIGPETFTYRELVRAVGKAIGTCKPVINMPPLQGYVLGKLVGLLHHDVTITSDEIKGLMAGLLYTDSPPAGKTRLTEWLKEHASEVGRHYHNELKRRTNRKASYDVS
jgi:uncharacterized protein YbjT (DUF2867 family)